MIRITKREGILLQFFLGVVLVLSLYKLCIEKKVMELDSVKVQRRTKEERLERIKYDANIRESSSESVHDEVINNDADMIDMLDYLFHGVLGDNINIEILNDVGYDTFKRGRDISIEGELTLEEFYKVLRMSEEMDEKVEVDVFKLIFIHEDKIKCNMRMRIF